MNLLKETQLLQAVKTLIKPAHKKPQEINSCGYYSFYKRIDKSV
jgi:hypothetical protein